MNEPNESVPPPDIPKPDVPPPPPPKPGEPGPETAGPPVELKTREPGESGAIATAAAGEASLNSRILAGLLDMLVSFGLTVAAGIMIPDFLGDFGPRLAGLVGLAYLLTRDCLPFLKGRSIGKTAMKLRAVTDSGEPLTNNWQTGILRNVALIIPFFALVELIILFTREGKAGQGRRLGDDWAKTKVIVDNEPVEGAGG